MVYQSYVRLFVRVHAAGLLLSVYILYEYIMYIYFLNIYILYEIYIYIIRRTYFVPVHVRGKARHVRG